MRFLLLSSALLLSAACGDDDDSTPSMDSGVEGDAAPALDAGPDAPPPRPCPPLPDVVPETEPTKIDVPAWMLGTVGDPSTSGDPVLDAIEAGTFTLPAEGLDDRGVDWFPVAPDDIGTIPTGLGGVFYAVAEIDVPEGMHVFARLDTALAVYVNGQVQPGDVYHSTANRVPLAVRPGRNLVAVRCFYSRRDPEVELFMTPDEISFNWHDLTLPDVRVGEMRAQWLGVPVLNATDHPVAAVTARVLESDDFEAAEIQIPGLAPSSVTKVPFELRPKHAFDAAELVLPVRIRVESCDLEASYETTVELETAPADIDVYRNTFRSDVDGSAQYYAVRPPLPFDPAGSYAIVLSLHGASVEAIAQARAYSSRDWTFVVAPTNRRPYGFDWEEWGRVDALEVLADAKRSFPYDETRVYLTGHSMGGHGTWHVGTLSPGLFATLGPSAGWSSFASYTGAPAPTGPIGRARAHSNTLDYLPNLARRGVYILHGSADDNVPVTEARNMYMETQMVTTDVVYYEQPGAGHWWDGSAAPGADCVDWPELFDFMQAHTLDPHELDFEFRTPGPWVSATHSYATIVSASDPLADSVIASEQTAADEVTLTTTNVRSLALDGDALGAEGIARVIVDGTSMDVGSGVMRVGPETGKRAERSGPLNQAFHRPFCFVYDDAASPVYQAYVSYLVSSWAVTGNGFACAVPASALGDDARAMNLIWVGVSEDALGADSPFDWAGTAISVGSSSFSEAAAAVVVPRGDASLDAVLVTTEGEEHLLFRHNPFSSRAGLPDYTVWTAEGLAAAGYFDPEWAFDPALGTGL